MSVPICNADEEKQKTRKNSLSDQLNALIKISERTERFSHLAGQLINKQLSLLIYRHLKNSGGWYP